MSESQSILMYYNGSAEAKFALNRIGEPALPCGEIIHGLTVAGTVSAAVSSVGLLSCRTNVREASCAKSAVDLERLLRADQPQRTL